MNDRWDIVAIKKNIPLDVIFRERRVDDVVFTQASADQTANGLITLKIARSSAIGKATF
jgi:hypothetical protein